MYYEVNYSQKIKNAKLIIENYNKRRYIDLNSIDFQEDKIMVFIAEQNNPYYMNYELTKKTAMIIAKETGLRILERNENGFILT